MFCYFWILINVTEICDTDLNRKISLCQELLDVAAILEPGSGIFRGKLLVDMQEAMCVQTERRLSNRDISPVVAKVRFFFVEYSYKIMNLKLNYIHYGIYRRNS